MTTILRCVTWFIVVGDSSRVWGPYAHGAFAWRTCAEMTLSPVYDISRRHKRPPPFHRTHGRCLWFDGLPPETRLYGPTGVSVRNAWIHRVFVSVDPRGPDKGDRRGNVVPPSHVLRPFRRRHGNGIDRTTYWTIERNDTMWQPDTVCVYRVKANETRQKTTKKRTKYFEHNILNEMLLQ